MNVLPENRVKILRLVEEKFNDEKDNIWRNVYYNTLRLLKFPQEHDIYNAYWKEMANEILEAKNITTISNQYPYRLTYSCHRYCYFNRSLGLTYRCVSFEATIVNLAMQELRNGFSRHVPQYTAKLVGFLIAYGHFHGIAPSNKILPEFLLTHLENLTEQLSIFDCGQISHGLYIFFRLKRSTE